MDEIGIRKIFESCEPVRKNLGEKKIDTAVESFPILDETSVNAFATSLSKLLAYRVSKDTYQRYSARIQVIELLREWVRPPAGLNVHPAFNQGDNMSEFIRTLVKKYLENDILNNKKLRNTNLVKLGKLLLNLSRENHVYVTHLKTFIDRIESLNLSCNEKDEFIEDILNSKDILNLESNFIDKLHIINAKKSFEIPILNNFQINLQRLKNNEELLTTDEFDKTIELISSSPRLFQLASCILKEFFLNFDYSLLVINYIKFLLKKIHLNNKNTTLNLYPTYLQSYVILMRVDNNCQTKNSMKYVLNSLSEIYFKNRDEILILLLHYPNWLEELSANVSEFI